MTLKSRGTPLKLLCGLGRAVVITLSLVGTYSVLMFVLQRSGHANLPTPDTSKSLVSPSGKYRADLATWAGGGGLAPYCNQALVVVPASVDARHAYRDPKYQVYSGECDNREDVNEWPEIRWAADNVLQVSLLLDSYAAGPKTVKLKKLDATRTVRIQFDIGE